VLFVTTHHDPSQADDADADADPDGFPLKISQVKTLSEILSSTE
jgi:hypothetical protein